MTEKLIKSITGQLPQIPLVIDQVGAAIKLAEAELNEESFKKALESANVVVSYAKEVSAPLYFKFNLVIDALIKNIPDVKSKKGFKSLQTTSNIVSDDLSQLEQTSEESERGYYKGEVLKLCRLIKENVDLFLVELADMHTNLKELKGEEILGGTDLEEALGLSFIFANIRMGDYIFPNSMQPYYNKFVIDLEKIKF